MQTREALVDGISNGDRAVTGLLWGLFAGVIMIVYLAISGALNGIELLDLLRSFNPDALFFPGEQAAPIQGFLLHLGISGVYGAVFGVLARWRPRPFPLWFAGLIYGGLLLLLANRILLPTGSSGLQVIPPLHFTIAHLLYGLLLGLKRFG
jgi:hypothetical protein